mgnify:CR=1 FL=1|tara:strand:- start:24 stop:464 length:441 start_codon:yes stop_codon:yes gene_type:complete
MLRLILLVFLLQSCATAPDQIGARYISGATYYSYECNKLRQLATQKYERIRELYSVLEANADEDIGKVAVGTILWFPSLFQLEGDGPEAEEFARIKGEYTAMKNVLDNNLCQSSGSNLTPPSSQPRSITKGKNPEVDEIGEAIIQE